MQKSPWMIYGTAWKKEDTYRCVQEALAAGFRAFDTACQPRHYYEWEVGRALEDAIKENKLTLDELFIQTKFTPVGGQDPQNIPYNPKDGIEKQILCSLEVSLKNLQTSYLDSLILHSPIVPYSEMKKVWQTFEQIYNQKVDEYNVNLDRYNLFIEQVKILINNYNVQVEVFNNCLNKIKD